MKKVIQTVIVFGLLALLGCQDQAMEFDASGAFEAKEVIVSSEANGRIVQFDKEEGEKVKEGAAVVEIDPTNYNLQKEQVEASMVALKEKTANAGPQVQILQKQIVAQKDQLAV